MSLPPEISKQNFEGLARAHAQNISGARQHDDKEKICKFFCSIFFTFKDADSKTRPNGGGTLFFALKNVCGIGSK